MSDYDVAIVGAGMAGASLAAALVPGLRVLLIEGEDRPGYHATGRSAAFWDETYGGPDIQPLTSASGAWLARHGFLSPRGALYLARNDQRAALDAFADAFAGTVALDRLARGALEARVPGLRAGWNHGIWIGSCADIDVAALHAHYLAAVRRAGGDLATGSPLTSATDSGTLWHLAFGARTATAAILVNAAGAWADGVARLAGARPLGIRPFRRTIAQLAVDPPAPAALPLVLDIGGSFYFKPDAGGRLWLSPHDETPAEPCDAAPEEIDVARGIDRLERAVDWRVGRVEHRWAGLRSFAPDRLPVYGFDPVVPRFFWCAGQGGFGIQTAPAGAALAAALLTGAAPVLPDAARYAPGRAALRP